MMRAFVVALGCCCWWGVLHSRDAMPVNGRAQDADERHASAGDVFDGPVPGCSLGDPSRGYCSTRYPHDVSYEPQGTYGVLRWHASEAIYTVPPVRIDRDGDSLLVTHRLRRSEHGTLTPEFP